ncbi:MAG TPA: hypothetical protein VKM72_33460 [Thermoanaerobaculia bacterium]|nr:hypothetical protein [Thermoanaerobaculia bacterium]
MAQRFRRSMSALALLALMLISTPLAARADEPPAPVDLDWGVKIPLRDGVRLNATVFRPGGQKETLPVVFTLTPYSRDGDQSYLARDWSCGFGLEEREVHILDHPEHGFRRKRCDIQAFLDLSQEPRVESLALQTRQFLLACVTNSHVVLLPGTCPAGTLYRSDICREGRGDSNSTTAGLSPLWGLGNNRDLLTRGRRSFVALPPGYMLEPLRGSSLQ